jgi:hypothetical protein
MEAQPAPVDVTVLEINEDNSVEVQESTSFGTVPPEGPVKLAKVPTADSSCFVCGVSLAELTLLVRYLCLCIRRWFAEFGWV